jgi:DNA modification methylase
MIKINLMKGDCLELMKEVPDKSVDLVLTDPPYGTTGCKWDAIIPFDKMWAELKRIVKSERSAILLFGSEPFSSHLRISNIKEFKYDWIWKKKNPSNFLDAKNRPLGVTEVVSVFCEKKTNYYPQNLVKIDKVSNYPDKRKNRMIGHAGANRLMLKQEFTNYPRTVLEYSKEFGLHTSQKPIALLEYLIKTYTLEGETVLDFTMGSGSTGVACKNLNRNFIGIERDDKYFEIAKERIEKA